jgi:hypothetical protein
MMKPSSWWSQTTEPNVWMVDFAINEWLIREGLLVLNEYPKTLTHLKS